MSDVVAVEYDLTPEDWISAMVSYSGESGLARRSLRRGRIVFALVLAVWVLVIMTGGSLGLAASVAVLSVVWIAAMPAVARRAQRSQLRRIADEGVANGTFGRHRVVLTAEGVLDSSEGYDSLIHWSAVERVREAEGALLIYNGPNSFLAVPLRAFPDRASFDAFSRRFFRGLEEAGRLAALTETEDGPGPPGA